MSFWKWLTRQPDSTPQDERIAKLERNEKRVEGLVQRRDAIMRENHLGAAIRKALEGPS